MFDRKMNKKIFFITLFISGAFFLFFGYPTNAQQVNISVTGIVAGTPTAPLFYCGDGICGSDESCLNCHQDCGGCGGVIIHPETTVIFKGQAYPFANITILKNGNTLATFSGGQDGYFEKQISGIAGGAFIFSIFAEDKNGKISEALFFTVTVLDMRVTTVSGIVIPPTITLNPNQAERGDRINIFGQAPPESEVNIFILPPESLIKAKASSSGDWSYELGTGNMQEGNYWAQAKAICKDGNQSPYSAKIHFSITKSACRGADLNFDGKVDLVDFSILLYFWRQTNPQNRCADINSDGIVNIIDFSIMMYWWNP